MNKTTGCLCRWRSCISLGAAGFLWSGWNRISGWARSVRNPSRAGLERGRACVSAASADTQPESAQLPQGIYDRLRGERQAWTEFRAPWTAGHEPLGHTRPRGRVWNRDAQRQQAGDEFTGKPFLVFFPLRRRPSWRSCKQPEQQEKTRSGKSDETRTKTYLSLIRNFWDGLKGARAGAAGKHRPIPRAGRR